MVCICCVLGYLDPHQGLGFNFIETMLINSNELKVVRALELSGYAVYPWEGDRAATCCPHIPVVQKEPCLGGQLPSLRTTKDLTQLS